MLFEDMNDAPHCLCVVIDVLFKVGGVIAFHEADVNSKTRQCDFKLHAQSSVLTHAAA